jgi:hypothetical protein
VLSLIATGACNRNPKEEEPPQLTSVVPVNAPGAAQQLLKGFYAVESGAWRWTAGNFSVLLRPPADAATKGATLKFKFTIPKTVMDRFQTVTLSADAGAVKLDPQTYEKDGEHFYVRDIPASAIQGNSVRVDFHLDHFQPPTPGGDQRELGVIASLVELDAK